MLTIVLAESALERVPRELSGHKQVMAAARHAGRKPLQTLLDGSLHHAAMRELDDAPRRGRPDIIHMALLTILESRANKAGHVRIIVHTRNDERINVDPETRLIRNYPRFCGLMEQLFEFGAVPKERRLLTLDKGWTLARVLKDLEPDRVLWLDPAADFVAPKSIFAEVGPDNVVAVIGGFAHGELETPKPDDAEAIGLGPEPLAVWTVASELLTHYQAQRD